MEKIYCHECGAQLINSPKFCKNCGTKVDNENINSNSNNNAGTNSKSKSDGYMSKKNNLSLDDLMEKIQILPILLGCLLSFVLFIVFGNGLSASNLPNAIFPNGISYAIIIGTLLSGFLSKDSVKLALIYGASASIIIVFLSDFLIFSSPEFLEYIIVYLIAGFTGSFFGYYIKIKIKNQ